MTAPALVALAHGSRDPRSAKTVRALVEADADVSIADRNGATPLQHAKARGYSTM